MCKWRLRWGCTAQIPMAVEGVGMEMMVGVSGVEVEVGRLPQVVVAEAGMLLQLAHHPPPISPEAGSGAEEEDPEHECPFCMGTDDQYVRMWRGHTCTQGCAVHAANRFVGSASRRCKHLSSTAQRAVHRLECHTRRVLLGCGSWCTIGRLDGTLQLHSATVGLGTNMAKGCDTIRRRR